MSESNPSHVEIDAQGRATSFVGPDATKLAAAIILRSAIKLWAKSGIIPTRGVTISKMLSLASNYTGKTYRAGKAGAAKAQSDLTIWIDAMQAAIPVQVQQ